MVTPLSQPEIRYSECGGIVQSQDYNDTYHSNHTVPNVSTVVSSPISSNRRTGTVNLTPTGTLTRRNLRNLQIHRLRGTLMNRDRRNGEPNTIFLRIVNLLPNRYRQPLQSNGTILYNLHPRPFLLLRLRVTKFRNTPNHVINEIFFTTNKINDRTRLPTTTHYRPFRRQIVKPNLQKHANTRLHARNNRVQPFLARRRRMRFFSRLVRPPRPTTTHAKGDIFRHAVRFLKQSRHRRNLATNQIGFYTK